jgi:ribonuclease BN (tRNA processing enzyme)
MKLTVLGSGTCVPSVKRGSPSYLLVVKGINILLDIGPGSLRQLARLDGNLYKKIDIVYISHHHTDHISDFEALIQALNWTPGFTRKKDLNVVGHTRLRPFIRSGIRLARGFKVKFLPLHGSTSIKGVEFTTAPGYHAETSLLLKIQDKGKTLVYVSDTRYDRRIADFARDCDVLLLENSFPASLHMPGHLNSHSSAKLANAAHAKKLVLTHFYPLCDNYSIKNQVKKYYNGPTILARDFLNITI